MKVRRKSQAYSGRIPECGELFMVPGGSGVYIRVSSESGRVDPRRARVVMGASLETGTIQKLDIKTSRRDGFVVLQPSGGVLEVERKPRK